MKNGIKRIGKGLFAIFMIKLTLLSGVLIFQACQTESNFEDEAFQESKNNFLNALQESNKKLQDVIIIPSTTKGDKEAYDLAKESTAEITTFKMCLLLNQDDPVDPTNAETIDPTGVNTLGDVFDTSNDNNTRPIVIDDTDATNISDDPISFGFSMCFDIQQEPTIEALDPAIVEAKNFLYNQGFNDNDIIEMLDGEEEAYLVPATIAIINALNDDSLADVNYNNYIYNTIGINTVYAQNSGDNYVDRTWSCFWEATGIGAFAESFKGIQSGNKALLKKAGKKAIKKLAARFLGPIGVAIAVVEFAFCMNR